MNKVTIDRELLEQVASEFEHANARYMLGRELRKILDAPRQPEGGGLEVVAWQDAENPLYTTGERRQMHAWATDGYPIVELCRLSDAQRAIAELREQVDDLELHLASTEDDLESARRNASAFENRMGELQVENGNLQAERDTLRQQLDEVKEQSETRWGGYVRESNLRRAIEQQRDLLAGLLRMVRQDGWYHPLEEHEIAQIDAALAEVEKAR